MILAHKILLDPNDVQRSYFARTCGVARFAYNWALAEWKRQLEANEKPTEGKLRKQLNAIKREAFPWMLEVTKCAPQLAIMNLGAAFKNFFEKRAEFPKFKQKGIRDSFGLSNDQFILQGKRIRIPNLGYVRMTERLRFEGKILSATISRKADRWFVSIQVEMPQPTPVHTQYSENQAIGVDLGVADLANLSDGTKQTGAKPHKALLARLRRRNQSLSRKVGARKGEKKSRNFIKARKELARLHAKIGNIRNDEAHKLTSRLTQQFSIIGIEDLNVSGMIQNRKLARAILDMSFYEFRRQLTYKAMITGSKVVVADRFFASSKLCHVCEHKHQTLKLQERVWTCSHCKTTHDRDINAAINLKNYAVSYTVPACGDFLELA